MNWHRLRYIAPSMKLKTFLLPILALVMTAPAWASWPLIEREPESILATARKIKRVAKKVSKTSIPTELRNKKLISDLQEGRVSAKDFTIELLAFNSIKRSINDCIEVATDDEYRPAFCQEAILKDVVLYLRSQKQIDDTAGLILLAHINQDRKQLNWLGNRALDIPSYLRTLEGLSKSLERKEVTPKATLLAQRNQRRNIKPWGRITPRQELFLKYNLFEIKVLNEILERTQKRIAAAKISIIVDYDGNGEADETIAVSPAERYRFAQNMLKLELVKETSPDGFLPRASVEGPHLIMASSELGFIDEAVLKQLTSMPELKSKKAQKGKIYLNALWSIGKAGLLAFPGGIYLALPIVIIESYFQGKKAQEAKNAPTLF